MRWERLFTELEARFDAEAALERDAEIADRTRRERAQIALYSRLLANVGQGTISLRLPGTAGPRVIVGTPTDVGPDWLLLVDSADRSVLVPLAALRSITGLRPGAQEPSLVGRRFTLGAALRAISRDRAVVDLVDVEGVVLTGTIDAVGADHLDLAEHAPDEPRRARHVVRTHVMAIVALGSIHRR